MNEYSLVRFENLSGRSIESDNSGQLPQKAKYRKHFANMETGEIRSVTDLDSRRYKRNGCISQFMECYKRVFQRQKISILAFVVDQNEFNSISTFLNSIGKKLKRRNIQKLGYIWIRDVGEIKFEKHFHLLIATSRITPELFHELFVKKKHSCYDVEFMKTSEGLYNYLRKKDLYGTRNQRSYGKSIEFKKPN